MTNDPNQEIFCNSITEELITALTRMDGLQVASQTSVFQYKSPRDIREIGKDLGVSAVLEGSVRMINERMRVTAQLCNAADGFHLCSETFDVKFEQDFAFQERLATAIATMTHSRL
jgi:TolB-like protein